MVSGKRGGLLVLLARMAWRSLRGRVHEFWSALRFDYAMVADAIEQARKEQRRGR